MQLISFLLSALTGIIIVDALLSWVMAPDKFPRSLTIALTAPLYRPIHAILDPRRSGGLDFSPIVILILIQVLRGALGL